MKTHERKEFNAKREELKNLALTKAATRAGSNALDTTVNGLNVFYNTILVQEKAIDKIIKLEDSDAKARVDALEDMCSVYDTLNGQLKLVYVACIHGWGVARQLEFDNPVNNLPEVQRAIRNDRNKQKSEYRPRKNVPSFKDRRTGYQMGYRKNSSAPYDRAYAKQWARCFKCNSDRHHHKDCNVQKE